MQVYPPPESDLLFQAFEWKWPNDGIGDAKLSIKLLRGIVVEGRVVEKETGKPVSEVALYFDPQRKNNPLFNKSSVSRFLGSDMKYITDAAERAKFAEDARLLADGHAVEIDAELVAAVSFGNLRFGRN